MDKLSIPKWIVIDSRQAITNFTSVICIPQRDLNELVHQIFDKLMEDGLSANKAVFPLLNMLICVLDPVHWTEEKMLKAFTELRLEIRDALINMNFTELIALDNGTFNYTFDSMRDNCIVLKHLNSKE